MLTVDHTGSKDVVVGVTTVVTINSVVLALMSVKVNLLDIIKVTVVVVKLV